MLSKQVIRMHENHPMLNLSAEVAACSAKIRQKFKLSVFVYLRLYHDNSCLLFSDNPRWIKHHLAHGYPVPAPLTINDDSTQIVYNHIAADGCFSQAKHDLRNLFNSYDAIDIAHSHKKYIDVFTWSLPINSKMDSRKLYLQNQKIFDGFMQNFTHDLRDTIKTANKNKIILPKSMRGLSMNASNQAYAFCRFTPQEKTCLDYLTSGYQAEEISQRLSISKRTAEKHLSAIRAKMGCFNNVGVVTEYLTWRYRFLEESDDALIKRVESLIAKNQKLSSLTARQRDCLLAFIQGNTIKQLAYKFQISTRTAEKHFEHIKAKLNCHSYLDIVAKYCCDV